MPPALDGEPALKRTPNPRSGFRFLQAVGFSRWRAQDSPNRHRLKPTATLAKPASRAEASATE